MEENQVKRKRISFLTTKDITDSVVSRIMNYKRLDA